MPTEKPLINFAHANGFPAGSYRTFFNYLTDDYRIAALEKYGHNPHYPIHSNWRYLVKELIAFIEKQQEPVIGIGHSFGGVLSFIAACQRPDLFKGLIMLDPPVFTGSFTWLLSLTKKTPLVDKFSPSGKSKKRQQYWPLNTDMVNYFANKGLFKNFDARCLKDYVDSAIIRRNNQHELDFLRDVETAIFRNVPSNLPQYKNKLTVPAVLIRGENSDVLSLKYFQQFANLNTIPLMTMPNGGHMFPLEQPEKSAMMIKDIIKDMNKNW